MEVWIVEACEFDMNESCVMGLFDSLAKAKDCVLTILKEKVMSMEDEIDDAEECDDGDWVDSYRESIKEYNEDINRLKDPKCYSIGNYFKVGGYIIYSCEVK